jgi:hypothetical protein
MIVRGSLSIDLVPAQDAAPSLTAVYSESVAVGQLQVRGLVELTGRSISVDLAEAEQQLRLHMTLFPPSPPASVLAGMMSGAAFVDYLAQPAATRIVMIRIPQAEASAIEPSDRYLDVAVEPFSGDLAALGVPASAAEAAELDRLLHAFLWAAGDSGSHIEAPATAYAELTAAVERLILPILQPAAPIPRPPITRPPG